MAGPSVSSPVDDVVVVGLGIQPGPQEHAGRETVRDLGPRAGESVAHGAPVARVGEVFAESDRRAQRRIAGKTMLVAHVRAVELGREDRLRGTGGLLAEEVVGAERKDGDAVARRQVVGRARLVVPVRERRVRREDRHEEARVRVAATEKHRAAAAVERRLDQGPGVEHAHVVLAMQLVGGRRGLARHDAPREAPVPRGVAARIEVDAVDEGRVDDRRAQADVKQIRDADPVEVVADVAGWSAPDVEEGQARDDRRDARHDLDGAERIAEDAGDLPHLGARERRGTRRLLVRSADEHLRDRIGRGRAGAGVGAGVGVGADWRSVGAAAGGWKRISTRIRAATGLPPRAAG